MKALSKLLAVILAVLGAFCGGLALGGHPEYLPTEIRDIFVDDESAIRAEILDAIKDDYYKKVDEKKLSEASYKGIIRQLDDRFSHYFTPEETDVFEQSVSGRFEGVGMTIQEHPKGLLVASLFDGSPAERAGILRGDIITHVNGEPIAGEPTDIATAKIKGKPGTSVRLSVVDGATKKRKTFKVKRASIQIPVVQSRLIRKDRTKLGYVRLLSFTDGAHGELRKQIDGLLRRDAQGFVLDLRGNGGGLLREAVLVSSIFIEDGTIVSTKGRRRAERKFEAEGKAIAKDIPLLVLVDGGTASASEIVTGALRDTKRATVAGERTFGKGVFQEVEPLSNGGALDLTVGSYFLPGGENISRKGIKPKLAARDNPRTPKDEALPVAIDELLEQIR